MLHLTPEIVEAAYEVLRLTKPFNRWKLPDPDEIEFRAVKMTGQDQAYCVHDGKRHVIAIAINKHTSLHSLIPTLAHEMLHMHLDRAYPRDRAHHGKRFHRHADQICRHHTFDRGQF